MGSLGLTLAIFGGIIVITVVGTIVFIVKNAGRATVELQDFFHQTGFRSPEHIASSTQTQMQAMRQVAAREVSVHGVKRHYVRRLAAGDLHYHQEFLRDGNQTTRRCNWQMATKPPKERCLQIIDKSALGGIGDKVASHFTGRTRENIQRYPHQIPLDDAALDKRFAVFAAAPTEATAALASANGQALLGALASRAYVDFAILPEQIRLDDPEQRNEHAAVAQARKRGGNKNAGRIENQLQVTEMFVLANAFAFGGAVPG